jgi:rhodanese-related sulfurtransferase
MSQNPKMELQVRPEWEVHPTQVKEWLDQQQALVLDVRQLSEWNAAHIPGAVLIPLDQLERRLGEIEAWKEKRVVVHCHHGVRSLRGAAFLRSKGFTTAHSMAGGLHAYSLLADSTVPKY